MYEKYHTEAVVLGSREYGEADRMHALYTKEFGLVWARAVSVRREASRLRYALQHFSRSHVSLIRGARGWRAAGAVSIATVSPNHHNTFARIARLTMRLVAGEETNEYLFATLSDAHARFAHRSVEGGAVELLCVARILYALGYLSAGALGTALFAHTAYDATHLNEVERARSHLLTAVNRALEESQL